MKPCVAPYYPVCLVLHYFLFQQPSFTPPVRATEGEVRYSIEIDVGVE